MAMIETERERANTSREEGCYLRWVKDQKIPIASGFYLSDLNTLPLEPWEFKGGLGSFVHLDGSQEALTDGYVCEIRPGGNLKPQKHLYEEIVYVLSGQGATSIWYEEGAKQTFEWQAGSLFALPINSWHQHFNGSGDKPARYYAVTDAPLVMNLFHNLDFVFNDPYRFTDRYNGEHGAFNGEGRFAGDRRWESNFVPDVGAFELQAHPERGGGRMMGFEVGNGTLTAHCSEFPVGQYKKAHRHGPGANVIILAGEGFSMLWQEGSPPQRVDWRPGSLLVPPRMWFHQHFNIGAKPARYLALRWGSQENPLFSGSAEQDVSVKEGGNQIEYQDEDPAILEMFTADCAKHGAVVDMARFFPNRG